MDIIILHFFGTDDYSKANKLIKVNSYEGHGLVIFTNRNSEHERHQKSNTKQIHDEIFGSKLRFKISSRKWFALL